MGDDPVSTITDFEADKDALRLNLNITRGAGGALDLSASGAGGSNLTYAGNTLVQFIGAQAPALDDMWVNYVLEGDALTNFTASNLNETLTVRTNGVTADAGAGNDILTAYDDDSAAMLGGDGDDTIIAIGATQYISGDSDAGPQFSDVQLHLDTVFGGAGRDNLQMTNGGQMTGGGGADSFGIDQLIGTAALDHVFGPAVITDFNLAEDKILVESDTIAPGTALSISVWANGLGADILSGTTVIAKVAGGQSLVLADIAVVANLRDGV